MSSPKMPFISSVRLAAIDDSYVVPTCLYYDGSRPLAGREAREKCASPEMLIEDFKLELGKEDSGADNGRAAATTSVRKATTGFAKDFFEQTLAKVESWLAGQGQPLPRRILVAEPLSLAERGQDNDGWLTNYRRSVRRALTAKFEEVDFLPEPFAAFQYYRHGIRHPSVAEARKNVALVLDFGGGTFDVSVIETTKRGDIRVAGANSKPLGAKSIPVGGYFINRLLVEDLLFSAIQRGVEKAEVRKALVFFSENRNVDEESLSRLNEKQQVFFRHYKTLGQDVERAKVAVCNGVANWSLNADLSGLVPYQISVPTNPFERGSALAACRIDAGKLRRVYEQNIWKEKLRDAVAATIKRASAELKGQEISVVLLSGGSSNIRWLRPLLERDLSAALANAQIVELSGDFSEIVAKGLAIECARRKYTNGQGDFRAVTYNRLCLALRVDGGPTEIRKLVPVSQALRSRRDDTAAVDDGVLLPSASSLRGLVEQPLRWRVRLPSPPRRFLEYYFLRSSFDPDDYDALQNPGEWRVATPPGTNFQQSIQVELTVREDGTAQPKFIYSQPSADREISVVGRPFGMDMTFAANEVAGETYLGFDFGTSTSACSFVSSQDIQLIEDRSHIPAWRGLTELVTELPYPVASALAEYLSETNEPRRLERGREAVEAMLTLASYASYMEYCSLKEQGTAVMKNLVHRSAGPLWALFKHCMNASRKQGEFCRPLGSLLDGNSFAQIDFWIGEIANSKHGKESTVDYVTFLGLLGNHLGKVFQDCELGVFEGVTPKRFSRGLFTGIFRSLQGASKTFTKVFEYEGRHPFAESDVYLVHPGKGVAICLSPLYVWNLDVLGPDVDLYEYDNARKDVFSFRAIQFRKAVQVEQGGALSEVWGGVAQLRSADVPQQALDGMKFGAYHSEFRGDPD